MARLLSVHAHPDDEASKGAPTVAKAVAEGHAAHLVCATGGEAGDILNPAMDRPEVRDNLAAIRALELEASVDIIGFHTLHWLGYRDSGMEGSEENAHPGCFANADLDEATGRLVRLIRKLRPHVIMTYSDDQQGYQHPDHLRVHDISVLAFDRAGDPNWYPDLGDPWEPQKLYYSLWSRERMLAQHGAFAEIGAESPYDERWFERKSLDHRITTRINIADYYGARRLALLAHRTQVDPDERFWFGLPDDVGVKAYPYEDYILARSRTAVAPSETERDGGVGFEDDLFFGVNEQASEY